MTIVIFLLVLAVLIFVHELGHFLAARAFGIRVDAFKIGFGPKICAWRSGETEYGVNWIPFGGYVRIHGENPDADSETGPDAGRSFINKPRLQQVVVLAAGVTFNFILAWFLYAGVFATGVTASPDGFEKYADRFENERIMIARVMPDSPAALAGVKDGDVVVSLDGVEDQTVEEIQAGINGSGGQSVVLGHVRDGQVMETEIVPAPGLVDDRYAVGISMSEVVDLRLPLFAAVIDSFRYTLTLIKHTFIGLYGFLADVVRGQPSFVDVTGPIGIAGIVGDASAMGFKYLVMITAIISINLGVVNLIPFPALDGGRILFVLIESLIRRRIPAGFANMMNFVGFALLMLLMVAVTWKDVGRLMK